MPIQNPLTAHYSEADLKVRRRKLPRYLPLSLEEERLLPSLSAPHREVLRATGSMKDRAARLKLPAGTLKSRLHRARRALAILLNQEINQGH
jgi:DNA-directed RNA polymerase specialized sigma24 family protein